MLVQGYSQPHAFPQHYFISLIRSVLITNYLTLLWKPVPARHQKEGVKCLRAASGYRYCISVGEGQLESQLNKRCQKKKIAACHNDNSSVLVHPEATGAGVVSMGGAWPDRACLSGSAPTLCRSWGTRGGLVGFLGWWGVVKVPGQLPPFLLPSERGTFCWGVNAWHSFGLSVETSSLCAV